MTKHPRPLISWHPELGVPRSFRLLFGPMLLLLTREEIEALASEACTMLAISGAGERFSEEDAE